MLAGGSGRRRAGRALAVLAVTAPLVVGVTLAAAAPRRHVVLIGDSTTFATGASAIQSAFEPARVLERLLRRVEPQIGKGGSPWKRAKVHNLAVGASHSGHWVDALDAGFCPFGPLFPVVARACEQGVPLAHAVRDSLRWEPDVILVTLGINDRLITDDPVEVVNRIARLPGILAPTPVLISPPFAPESGPLRAWALAVRDELRSRGLLTGVDWPVGLPTFDGIHLTDGGYAAAAGLWVDVLHRLP